MISKLERLPLRENKEILACKNSRHFLAPPLVFPEMTSEDRAQKFHFDDPSLPSTGRVVLLISWTNQMHHPVIQWFTMKISQNCGPRIACQVALSANRALVFFQVESRSLIINKRKRTAIKISPEEHHQNTKRRYQIKYLQGSHPTNGLLDSFWTKVVLKKSNHTFVVWRLTGHDLQHQRPYVD